jgi:predicted nucleic acid-binding Zn ribbon protein
VLHAPPIIFKGSGFYTTDYKRSGNGGRSSDDGHDHSHSDSSEESVTPL